MTPSQIKPRMNRKETKKLRRRFLLKLKRLKFKFKTPKIKKIKIKIKLKKELELKSLWLTMKKLLMVRGLINSSTPAAN